MTPFVFKKISEQYELSQNVEFNIITNEYAVTKKMNNEGHTVSQHHCSCMFFSAMQITCRHIFKFLAIKNFELFLPELCAKRWTKSYYYQSHPALNNYEETTPVAMSVVKRRVPEEIEKYKRTANVTKEINHMLSNMSNSEYRYYLDKIQSIRTEIISSRQSNVEHIQEQESLPLSENNLTQCASQVLPQTQNVEERLQHDDQENSQPIVSTPNEVSEVSSFQNPNFQDHQQESPNGLSLSSQKEQIEDTTAEDITATSNIIQYIRMPNKMVPIGRPRGSGKTVIGTKRQNSQKPEANIPPKKVKFFNRSSEDQGRIIVNWLTNESFERIGKNRKKYTNGNVIQDQNIFNRLRNKTLDISLIKKYFDNKTFTYIEGEIDRLNNRPIACIKCKKTVSQPQVMCNGCLDLYHGKCLGLTAAQARNTTFFCADC